MKNNEKNPGRREGIKNFSPEFKLMLATLSYSGEKSFENLAREFKVSPMSIRKWKKTLHEKGSTIFGGEEKEVVEEKTECCKQEECSPKIREQEICDNASMYAYIAYLIVTFIVGTVVGRFI